MISPTLPSLTPLMPTPDLTPPAPTTNETDPAGISSAGDPASTPTEIDLAIPPAEIDPESTAVAGNNLRDAMTRQALALDAARKDDEAMQLLRKESAELHAVVKQLREEIEAMHAKEDRKALEEKDWAQRELAQEKELKVRTQGR